METIIVPTPAGDLIIENKNDGDYPGVYISIGGNEAPVATIEYTDLRNIDHTAGIQVCVWEDASDEEPSAWVNVDGYENY